MVKDDEAATVAGAEEITTLSFLYHTNLQSIGY
jgi:hypothetical protein